MAEVNAVVHPRALADVLANAFLMGKEKVKAVKPCPTILLAYDETNGPAFYAYGMGRYLAGRSRTLLESKEVGAFASVSLTRENADTLRAMLGKSGTGANGNPTKGDTVAVMISDEPKLITSVDELGQTTQKYVNLVITNTKGTLAELSDADPEGKFDGCWDFIDQKIKTEVDTGAGRMTFLAEILGRLKDVKSDGPAIDLKKTSHDRITAVAIGSNFRGVMGDVGREVYSEGGPWKNGPGQPDHLLD